jgi:hypothetical protein
LVVIAELAFMVVVLVPAYTNAECSRSFGAVMQACGEYN